MIRLKIEEVEVFRVLSNFEWNFMRICASNDLCGIGEGGPMLGFTEARDQLKSLLKGEDAMRINRIEQKLRYASLYSGSSLYHLLSAVNIALYDLIGKYLNSPVWRLLGGDRDEIRLYSVIPRTSRPRAVSSMQLSFTPPWVPGEEREFSSSPIRGRITVGNLREELSPERYVREAEGLVKEGFKAVKFDLDLPTPFTAPEDLRSGNLSKRDLDHLSALVKELRERVGPEVDLIADFQWSYNVSSAIRLCRALEPYGLRWIEDPTPAVMAVTNLDQLASVSDQCGVPIGTGENLYTLYEFKDLLKAGVRVWTPAAVKTGGISEVRRIGEFASMYEVEVSPHNVSSPVGTAANAHASSPLNSLGLLEFLGHRLKYWSEVTKKDANRVDSGRIRLSEEPGLGVELDVDRLQRISGQATEDLST